MFVSLKLWISLSATISAEAMLEGTIQMVSNCFLTFQSPLSWMKTACNSLPNFSWLLVHGLESLLQLGFDYLNSLSGPQAYSVSYMKGGLRSCRS